MEAYMYYIKWTNVNKCYVGIRKSKTIDLWIKYFTSSKIVSMFRKEYGEPDIITILETFNTYEEAIKQENKYLSNISAAQSDNWLNRCNGNKTFYCREHSSQTRKKISDSNLGKKRSIETCQKISNALKGQIIPDIVKEKMSISAKKRSNTKEGKIKLYKASLKGTAVLVGKKLSQEQRKKLSLSSSLNKPIEVIYENGRHEIYHSQNEFARKIGVNCAIISQIRRRGKISKKYGFLIRGI